MADSSMISTKIDDKYNNNTFLKNPLDTGPMGFSGKFLGTSTTKLGLVKPTNPKLTNTY